MVFTLVSCYYFSNLLHFLLVDNLEIETQESPGVTYHDFKIAEVATGRDECTDKNAAMSWRFTPSLGPNTAFFSRNGWSTREVQRMSPSFMNNSGAWVIHDSGWVWIQGNGG